MRINKVRPKEKACQGHVCDHCGETLYPQSASKAFLIAAIISLPLLLGSAFVVWKTTFIPDPPQCFQDYPYQTDSGTGTIRLYKLCP